MIEHIKNGWVNLESVGFYPWVSIAGLGMLFIIRAVAGKEKLQAVKFVFICTALSQAYMMLPDKAPEISGMVNIIFALVSWLLGLAMWTMIQVFASAGAYSFVEAFGIMDRLGGAAQKALDKLPWFKKEDT